MSNPKYPVTVKLVGENGNAFFIMASVARALKEHGVSEEEITAYTTRSMQAKSYDDFLRIAMETVNVE